MRLVHLYVLYTAPYHHWRKAQGRLNAGPMGHPEGMTDAPDKPLEKWTRFTKLTGQKPPGGATEAQSVLFRHSESASTALALN